MDLFSLEVSMAKVRDDGRPAFDEYVPVSFRWSTVGSMGKTVGNRMVECYARDKKQGVARIKPQGFLKSPGACFRGYS